jgi:lipopolysaccharide transport system ATP-binding protein
VTEVAVVIEGLSKSYRIGSAALPYRRLTESASLALRAGARRVSGRGRRHPGGGDSRIWALKDVSLEINEGDVLGVIGRNGAGKTTLLKILSGITEPSRGYADLYGRVGSLLEVGAGFHPELTGRENIYLNGAILGMRRGEVRERFDQIVEFAGIDRFLDTPVKRYSSGMYVRLAFAVAAHLEADILLIDEVLAVGDVAFQRKCLGRMGELAHSGRTVLFVSHNLAAVSALCSRACLIESGELVLEGPVEAVVERHLATLGQDRGSELRDRVDREGNGRLRFTGVEVAVAGGVVQLGDDTEILLHYEAEEEIANVLVSVAFYGLLGDCVFLCSNKLTGDDLTPLPRVGVFRCTVPRLPLLPGRYSLNIYSEANGYVADWVQDAHLLDVVESDFFGSGQLPPSSHGKVVVAHSWDVSPSDGFGGAA